MLVSAFLEPFDPVEILDEAGVFLGEATGRVGRIGTLEIFGEKAFVFGLAGDLCLGMDGSVGTLDPTLLFAVWEGEVKRWFSLFLSLDPCGEFGELLLPESIGILEKREEVFLFFLEEAERRFLFLSTAGETGSLKCDNLVSRLGESTFL